LTLKQLTKTHLIYRVSCFNLAGDWSFVWGAKPPVATGLPEGWHGARGHHVGCTWFKLWASATPSTVQCLPPLSRFISELGLYRTDENELMLQVVSFTNGSDAQGSCLIHVCIGLHLKSYITAIFLTTGQ